MFKILKKINEVTVLYEGSDISQTSLIFHLNGLFSREEKICIDLNDGPIEILIEELCLLF